MGGRISSCFAGGNREQRSDHIAVEEHIYYVEWVDPVTKSPIRCKFDYSRHSGPEENPPLRR
eukprot:IDg4607t1